LTLNCNGILLALDQPKAMGVININEDSFYAKSRAFSMQEIESKANYMLIEGAAILDIGTMSSKPGSPIIDQKLEWSILEPVIEKLSKLNVILSIDTVWSLTAQKAIDKGAHIINDISGGSIDPAMIETVANLKNTPFIVMHMNGTPETMQQHTNYENINLELLNYFAKKIRMCLDFGLKDLIIDPGFGFSKTLDQNYTLLHHLGTMCIFDLPILVGLSRKSMLYKYLETSPEEALNATTVANTIALSKGAKILRVHDVKPAVEAIKIYEKIYNA
jgi:dihydropteroate synthase